MIENNYVTEDDYGKLFELSYSGKICIMILIY